jgi:hypothetical protein
MWNQ